MRDERLAYERDQANESIARLQAELKAAQSSAEEATNLRCVTDFEIEVFETPHLFLDETRAAKYRGRPSEHAVAVLQYMEAEDHSYANSVVRARRLFRALCRLVVELLALLGRVRRAIGAPAIVSPEPSPRAALRAARGMPRRHAQN